MEETDESDVVHPLFMTGLPIDFQSNRHLAALASLMDDDDDDKNNKDNCGDGEKDDVVVCSHDTNPGAMMRNSCSFAFENFNQQGNVCGVLKSGGGKVRRVPSRVQRSKSTSAEPYTLVKKPNYQSLRSSSQKIASSSVAETHLFLKLWKISWWRNGNKSLQQTQPLLSMIKKTNRSLRLQGKALTNRLISKIHLCGSPSIITSVNRFVVFLKRWGL